MIFERLILGSWAVNCFIVACEETKAAAVVDPGDDADAIMQKIKELGLELKKIIVTHGHCDHIEAINKIREKNNVELLAHTLDVPMLADPKLNGSDLEGTYFKVDGVVKGVNDGDVIEVGGLKFTVIHTPGHTQGSMCLLINNILFSGDTLFYEGIGRTDFPGGDPSAIIPSIKNKLFTLSPEIKVYPGHGRETSIGHEIKNNPFVY